MLVGGDGGEIGDVLREIGLFTMEAVTSVVATLVGQPLSLPAAHPSSEAGGVTTSENPNIFNMFAPNLEKLNFLSNFL
jgi:hypothetical protein